MSPKQTIAVLMAVYDQVSPSHLTEALTSIEQQTRRPDEVVIVADGPLSAELDHVIDGFRDGWLPLRRVDLPSRRGAGPARQAGLEAIASTWVAIADADDVSISTRLQRQLEALRGDDVEVLGAAMEEFDDTSGEVLGVRRFGSTHGEVVARMRSLNPVNQPAVVFRRDAVMAAGGYRDVPMLEDYELWVRMFRSGARFANLPDVLVRFRGGVGVHRRRTSGAALRSEWTLQLALRDVGLIGWARAAGNWVARTGYRLAPAPLGRFAYRRIFLPRADRDPVDRPAYDRYQDMRESRAPLADSLARQALRTAGIAEGNEAGLRVLDVGSGYGDTAISLASRGAEVLGLEPARELYEYAVRRARDKEIANLRFLHGGVEDLAAVAEFDLVVLDNVFEHLPDQKRALAAIGDSLCDGGKLYLLVPNKLWPIEAHYHLPFLSWLPLPVANTYLRLSRRGTDYRDASYAPTYWGLRRSLMASGVFDVSFRLPADRQATVAGSPLHYRLGMALIERIPALWLVSKALLVVATRRPRT